MLSPFVSTGHRRAVKVRMFVIPLMTTLTMLICFWSIQVSLGIYLLLLPFYMVPGLPEFHVSLEWTAYPKEEQADELR